MAPQKGKRKVVSREQRFHRQKDAESAERQKRNNGKSSAALQAVARRKGKQRAKEADEDEDDPHPFRYRSFNDRLASVHITSSHYLGRGGTGAIAGLDGYGISSAGSSSAALSLMDLDDDKDDSDEDSLDSEGEETTRVGRDARQKADRITRSSLHSKTSFSAALQTWRELNLSLPFASLLQRIQPLSQSLPLMLHNQAHLTTMMCETLEARHSDSYLGYEPVLDLIPRMAADLGPEFLHSYPRLLSATLQVTTISKLNTGGDEHVAALIVERAFESVAATLRCLAPYILREAQSTPGSVENWLLTTWSIVRPFLGWTHSPGGYTGIDDETPTSRLSRKTVPSHTRRFASEAFAHLVRRAKGDQLQEIASAMLTDLVIAAAGIDHRERSAQRFLHFAAGVAGVWFEAVKSVDARLHSDSTIILDSALTSPAEGAHDTVSFTRTVLGNLVFTAVVHHGNAASLLPIFRWLQGICQHRLQTADASPRRDAARRDLCESLSWLTTFVGTRKGKRLDDSAKAALFRLMYDVASRHASLDQDSSLHRAMLELFVVALPLGRIQDLIGSGVKLIDALAAQGADNGIPALFRALALALSDLQWSGYKQFILPSLLDVTARALQGSVEAQSGALEVLCAIQQRQGLTMVLKQQTPSSTRWSNALYSAVATRLAGLSCAKETAAAKAEVDTLAALQLAPMLHSRSGDLFPQVCEAAAGLATALRKSHSEPQGVVCSPIEMLCLLLELAATFIKEAPTPGAGQHMAETLVAKLSTGDLVSEISHHRHAVVAIASLSSALELRKVDSGITLDVAKDGVRWAMMSTDAQLRESAAVILASAEGGYSRLGDFRPRNRIVEIEQTQLTVENMRERNVRTRALARDLLLCKERTPVSDEAAHKQLDAAAVTIIDYFASTFKLNFRPLWAESRNALVELGAKYGQDVWSTIFRELRSDAFNCRQDRPEIQGAVFGAKDEKLRALDICYAKLERHFQDPQLSEVRRDALSVVCDSTSAVLRQAATAQKVHGRLDAVNYQAQLLESLVKIPLIAERNNAELVKHFFATLVEHAFVDEADGENALDDDGDSAHGSSDDDEEVANGTNAELKAASLSKLERRDQLCAYLDTFSHFSNPKALYRSADLHSFLYRLLARGDGKVQRKALDAILQWKDPGQTTYADILKDILDPRQFRERLTSLRLAKGPECSIQPAHRSSFLTLVERIFFGIMTARQSRAQGQANGKVAILTALADLEAEELVHLVNVMLEPFAAEADPQLNTDAFRYTLDSPTASMRKQAGFVAILQEVIRHLGLNLLPFWDRLIACVFNITRHASIFAEVGQGPVTQAARTLRQNGLKRINDFFLRPTDAFDWTQYLAPLFRDLVSPRLAGLRVESIQSPSALLELIHTWSQSRRTVFYLVDYDSRLIGHLCACLQAQSIKASVVGRILDVLESILALAGGHDEHAHQVVQRIVEPNATAILESLEIFTRYCDNLKGAPARAMGRDEIIRRLLHLLAQLSSHLSEPADVTLLLQLLSPLLKRGNAVVPEKSKVDVLNAFERLLPKWTASAPSSEVVTKQYDTLSGLFSRLRSRPARDTLCRCIAHLAASCNVATEVVDNVAGLNAFDKKRMGEYDFDRRLAAFDYTSRSQNLNAKEWLPLLHNLVYYLQEPDEMAIRSSSSASLRHFVDVVADLHEQSSETSASFDSLYTNVVYFGIRRSLRSTVALVQREAVELLGYSARKLPWLSYFAEMQGLLVEGDEEASFFNNVHHIQMHRRLRALLRLGQEAKMGALTTRTISETLLPLVESLLHTDSNHGDGNLIGHAVDCIGLLSSQLKWGPYNVLLWKYLSYARSDEEEKKISTKVSVRASMSILDHFHFNMEDDVGGSDKMNGEETALDADDEQRDEDPITENDQAQMLALELSRKVLDAVRHRLLPRLMGFLDLKDELEDAVRVPIAMGVARVLLRLPTQHQYIEITRLLAVLANVLKSKSQETRNLARSTMANVATTLGPRYFPAVVKALRKALTRGPQVAVLAFTAHSVLLHCIEPEAGREPLSKLTHGTRDLVDIVVEDVFGHTAEDRHSIENRTTYREVKASKSLDTIEHVARVVDNSEINTVLQPLRDLMSQTEALQAVKGFDDCLRRIAVGLQSNQNLDNTEYLVLCHTLLTNTSKALVSKSASKGKGIKKASAVLSRRNEVEDGAKADHFVHNAHRFVIFGLDMLFSALRRGRFDAEASVQAAKLDPLVASVGNCLFAQQSGVVAIALRTLARMVRLPLPSAKAAVPVLTKQTLKLIEQEGNSQSDVALGSVKLLAVIIRDRTDLEVRPTDGQLSTLCRYIGDNLEENNDIQGTLFGLLRALIARKYLVSEIYDVMDKVANMLVVHQSDGVRAMSRAAYLDYVLDLPQGQKRFANQMQFLAKNLSYTFESGRLNVLELVKALCDKASEDVLRPFVDLFFMALVMRLANDDSSKCRQQAADLIVRLVRICRENELAKLLQLTQSWAQADVEESRSSRNLVRIAMTVYGIMVDAHSMDSQQDIAWMRRALTQGKDVLHYCAAQLSQMESTIEDDVQVADGDDLDWTLAYQTLQLATRLHKRRQSIWQDEEMGEAAAQRAFAPVWADVQTLLLFPHSWVRLSSSRLIGEHLATRAVAAPSQNEIDDDVQAGNLADLVDLSRKSSLAMRSANLDDALALQIVKNLVHLGKSFAHLDSQSSEKTVRDRSTIDTQPDEQGDEDSDGEGEPYGKASDGPNGHARDEGDLWRAEPLRWLFIRLSHQVRYNVSSGPLSASAAICSSSILKWMAAMMNYVDPDLKARYVLYVVAPIFRILEGGPSESSAVRYGRTVEMSDAVARRTALEQLATEVQELVQAKVGTSTYAAAYAQTKRRALDRRRERRTAAIQRTMDFPEAALARKASRNQNKHESRKRKGQAFSQSKGHIKSQRRRQ